SYTIDELDDTNEQLVDLRGEGRYFGKVIEDLGPTCRNCHKRGHMAKDCKVVVCITCGAIEDHYTANCPTHQRCSNCGQGGHLRRACTEKSKFIYCKKCDSRNHPDEMCPTIWRSYMKKVGADVSAVDPKESTFCYNCGEKNHYGDDCIVPRVVTLRYQESSAFSGVNLPKQFVKAY
ncbi:hypothetical protein NADFUDRAFT_14593, partial [Nadsonia fulvescens var. elongata DSM 6958]